jgi:hypothetical protein
MSNFKEAKRNLLLLINQMSINDRTYTQIVEPFKEEQKTLLENWILVRGFDSNGFTFEFETPEHLKFRKISTLEAYRKSVLSKKIMSEMKKGKVVNS